MQKKFNNFWEFYIVGAVLFVLLCMLASSYQDLNRIQCRDEGVWAIETLTSEGEVTGVGTSYTYANGRRRRRQHNISVYIKEADDYTGMHLSEEELAQYVVGDTVTVIREVYYLKPGFRVFYVDSLE